MPDVSAPKSFSSEGGAVPNSYEARASLPGATIEPYTEEFSAEMEKAERLTSFDSAGNSSTNLSATSRQGGMYALREAAIARDDFMATATTKGGRPIAPSEVTPDSLVTLDMGNGARVEGRIADFERLGKIRRTAIGWERVGASQAPTTTQRQEVPQGPAHYDREAVELNGRLAHTLGSNSLVAIAQDLAQHGEVQQATMRRIAASSNVPEGTLAGIIGTYSKLHGNAAVQATAALGIDAGAVTEWAKANAPADLRKAIDRQLQSHDTGGWQALAKRAAIDLANKNPAEAIKAIHPKYKPQLSADRRTVLVTINGRTTSYTAALGNVR